MFIPNWPTRSGEVKPIFSGFSREHLQLRTIGRCLWARCILSILCIAFTGTLAKAQELQTPAVDTVSLQAPPVPPETDGALKSLPDSPRRSAVSSGGPPEDWYTPPGDSSLVIDTFDYPDDWDDYPDSWEGHSGWRQAKAKKKDVYYKIAFESGNFFLTGETTGKAVNFGTKSNINLRLHNKLRWRWRAHNLPEGGNENVKDKNDSGAAIRLVFKGRGFTRRTLKYVWSTTLPVGTETQSPLTDNTKVVVLQSGPQKLGQWVWEEVDTYDDYKRLFGGEPRLVEFISVITDSDNTKTLSKADYDDITFIIAPPDTTELNPDFKLESQEE